MLFNILFAFFITFSFNCLASERDLSGLKDVILGQKPSLFPLPIGWWCVIILCCLLLFCFFFLIKRTFFPSTYLYTKKEIDALKKKNLTPVQTAKELSKILKRIAILKFGSEQTASLTHQEWKKFLKDKSHDPSLTKEIDLISKASFLPPEKNVAISNKCLYNYAEKWAKTVLKGK